MTRRLRDAVRSLAGSVGIRLALDYGMLAILTMAVLVSVFYVQTVGVLRQGNARDVAVAAQRMLLRHAVGGGPALESSIRQTLTDGIDAHIELYLLLDPGGAVRAGNFNPPPLAVMPVPGRPVELQVVRGEEIADAMMQAFRFDDESLLLVGREIGDQKRIETLVLDATVAGGLITLLLILGGTFWFRVMLDRRIGAIRRTAARIGDGDLGRRIPDDDEEDEFAHLNRDINRMLDRIETLMDGVRHVSNAIAHDLRTPLTRILTSLEAAGRSESPTAMRAAHEVAIHEIEVLTQLLEKLLQIAEAEAGTHRQAFRPTNLDQIADDVVDLFAAVAEDRGAQLQRQAAAPPVVLGDSDLLAGAVANLVDNALKHTGAGARILVATGCADGSAVVTVEDNGPGVPAAAQPSLGQRFFRRDPSVPGFGLGLTSVRAIVSLHGGSIRFEDAEPGLRVQIRLPVLAD